MSQSRIVCSTLFVITLIVSRFASVASAAVPTVEVASFGKLPTGEEVQVFTLKNRHGMQAKVIEYGATISELRVADANGKFDNVILGADSLEAFTKGFPAASVIGRFANRIRGATFKLDEQEIHVAKNMGDHHIHGGSRNFAKVVWEGKSKAEADRAVVTLSYTSRDGEEGFPGNLVTEVTYSITDKNELVIEYRASTDKVTVINLTNHAYFNLSGSGDVLQHELQFWADKYTVSDTTLIPTGEIRDVASTALDFREMHRIGERIEQLYESARGYDHNFIINGQTGELRKAARVRDPKSGRVLECLTTEPGVQLYTANGFKDNPYPKHGAFCLETQHYPDSPNHPEFPTTQLRPGEEFKSTTIFRFSNHQ